MNTNGENNKVTITTESLVSVKRHTSFNKKQKIAQI